MTPTMIATLGGLIGSTLTMLGSRILDLVQRKREHYYDLKKTFFTRKLSVAEAAISQWYISASCLRSLSILFEVASKNTALIMASPPDFLKSYLDSVSQQMAKLSAAAFDPANAISLFFDLDELQNVALAKEIIDLMMSIDGHFAALKFLSQYIFAKNETERAPLFPAWDKTFKEMQADIVGLAGKIEQGSQLAANLIGKIRGEMKKFEL